MCVQPFAVSDVIILGEQITVKILYIYYIIYPAELRWKLFFYIIVYNKTNNYCRDKADLLFAAAENKEKNNIVLV